MLRPSQSCSLTGAWPAGPGGTEPSVPREHCHWQHFSSGWGHRPCRPVGQPGLQLRKRMVGLFPHGLSSPRRICSLLLPMQCAGLPYGSCATAGGAWWGDLHQSAVLGLPNVCIKAQVSEEHLGGGWSLSPFYKDLVPSVGKAHERFPSLFLQVGKWSVERLHHLAEITEEAKGRITTESRSQEDCSSPLISLSETCHSFLHSVSVITKAYTAACLWRDAQTGKQNCLLSK